MKLILISDLHCRPKAPVNRKDDYVEAWFRKLEYIIDYAEANDGVILCAGDLLDSARPPIWLLNKLITYLRGAETPMRVIAGNHDQVNHNPELIHESALWTLDRAGAIRLITWRRDTLHDSETGEVVYLTCLPFGEDLPEDYTRKPGFNVFMCHIPVYESSVPFYMEGHALTVDQLEARYPGYDLYFAGDIHIPAVRSKTIVSGSLMRSTIAQKDYKPRFYEFDTLTGETTPHFLPNEEDVWKEQVDPLEDESYRAELKELSDIMLARTEKPDFPRCIQQLSEGKPHLQTRLRGIIDDYLERT